MSYVPIVTSTHTPRPPSRQTEELANLLGRVIQEYESAHPTMTGPEVSQALQLAKRASSKAGGSQMVAGAVAALAGLLVMGGLIAFYLFSQGGGGTVDLPWTIVGIVVLGILAALVAVARRTV